MMQLYLINILKIETSSQKYTDQWTVKIKRAALWIRINVPLNFISAKSYVMNFWKVYGELFIMNYNQ